MLPAAICQTVLGAAKLADVIEELSAPQVKAILKQAGLKAKSRSGFVPQKERRRVWSEKILAAVDQGDDDAASELLQQWLLHHRRVFLIDYLDALEVKHRDGETDETFLVSRTKEVVQSAAAQLIAKHESTEVAAYLLYIAHQQRSSVFDEWDGLTNFTSR